VIVGMVIRLGHDVGHCGRRLDLDRDDGREALLEEKLGWCATARLAWPWAEFLSPSAIELEEGEPKFPVWRVGALGRRRERLGSPVQHRIFLLSAPDKRAG